MSKEVLALDVDEVMFPFLREFTQYHNQLYGTELYPEQFDSYRFDEIVGLPRDDMSERIYSFHQRDDSHIKPLDGAQEALRELHRYYDLVAVTARHPQFEQSTKWWLDLQGLPVGDVHAIGFEGTIEGQPTTKAEVCRGIGAVALIDDSPKHVLECHDAGIDATIFGDYSWNQTGQLPEVVQRCSDWPAVLLHLGIHEPGTI